MKRILFIIYEGEIRFVPDEKMSCKEYYESIGGDLSKYKNVIRGMIRDGKLVFMKENLQYDNETIAMAKKCGPIIKQQLNMPDLEVGCGVFRGETEEDWKPMFLLKEETLSDEQKELLSRTDNTPNTNNVIDFKNDISDDNFAKYASKFSLYLLIATIIVKVVLHFQHNLDMDNRWISLLVFIQVISLVICTVGYKLKSKITKFVGLLASFALFFLLDLPDIIIGIINLLFTIDQTYIVKILEFFNNLIHKKKK